MVKISTNCCRKLSHGNLNAEKEKYLSLRYKNGRVQVYIDTNIWDFIDEKFNMKEKVGE